MHLLSLLSSLVGLPPLPLTDRPLDSMTYQTQQTEVGLQGHGKDTGVERKRERESGLMLFPSVLGLASSCWSVLDPHRHTLAPPPEGRERK